MKMNGLDWSPEQTERAMNKFRELKLVLEDRFNEKDFQRMGQILIRHGAVIEKENKEVITGEEKITLFFEENTEKSIEINKPRIVYAGTINKIVEGYPVDKWALVEFDIHLTNNNTLQNQTYTSTILLMHRNNCPWDG